MLRFLWSLQVEMKFPWPYYVIAFKIHDLQNDLENVNELTNKNT